MIRNEVRPEKDIAVIGMSGKFPGANDLYEFWDNLKEGKDVVRDFPYQRKEELTKLFGRECDRTFVKGGYLENITLFEPEIFHMSEEECKYMEPSDRLIFELVEQAILDAGYQPNMLAGREIGIYLSANGRDYSRLCEATPMSKVNQLQSSIVGKLAYYYDTHGPAATVDCACASSLLAVYQACTSLSLGKCESVIAGGVNLMLVPVEVNDIQNVPVLAQNQIIKPFDADANGMLLGEGGGIVILKLLKKAIEDGDNIHAIIRGYASNSDGRRSNGMLTPSPEGQTEVIRQCIRNAKIDPKTISYIETHGTGTPIGDPIEFSALSECFEAYGCKKQSIAIGSLKASIGHLDYASGIANLLKVILMLKNKKIPASLHFDVPNPNIDFINSPLYVNYQCSDWTTDGVRRAGVTALGLIGTNVHMILEEALNENEPEERKCHVIELSGRTKFSLDAMARNLLDYMNQNDTIRIEDIAATLHFGRRSYAKKLIFTASNHSEMKKALNDYLMYDKGYIGEGHSKSWKAILVLPDILWFDVTKGIQIAENFPLYQKNLLNCQEILEPMSCNQQLKDFVCYLTAFGMTCKDCGIPYKSVYGYGLADPIADILTQTIPLSEGLYKIKDMEAKRSTPSIEKIAKFVKSVVGAGFDVFLLPFMADTESKYFTDAIAEEKAHAECIGLKNYSFSEFLVDMASYGVKPKWELLETGNRISLPGYVFDRRSYYVKLNLNMETYGKKAENNEETQTNRSEIGQFNKNEIRQNSTALFSSIYGNEKIDLNMNILDLQMDSIQIMQFVAKVNDMFRISLPASLFFENRSLESIFQQIEAGIVS